MAHRAHMPALEDLDASVDATVGQDTAYRNFFRGRVFPHGEQNGGWDVIEGGGGCAIQAEVIDFPEDFTAHGKEGFLVMGCHGGPCAFLAPIVNELLHPLGAASGV